MNSGTLTAAVLLALVALAGGCDTQESAWQQARDADTIPAYQGYLEEFGDSPQAREAEQRLRALQAAAMWEEIKEAETTQAYERFLGQFPDTEQADEARARLGELERQQAWAALQSSTDVTALRAFAERNQEHSVGAEAQQRIADLEQAAAREQARLEAERREAAERTHRVQLAAFSSEQDAERSVRRLTERFAGALGETRLETGRSGSFYLVRTAPLKQPAAATLCARLKEQNQDCLVMAR